ncbi:uncharacterized protein CEXT_414761 [Caerostris extrusa]|uniref:Uncharacterized protein n=1 Tax=Caerostris extrusa TaxID=172846 RepID=A0AAV4RTW0_CAEEX|nr:uncharacterized protein CEXT_414761 [Caerostris extrusa]
MAESRQAPFTLVWTIENFSPQTCLTLSSPSFIVESMGNTKWHIELEDLGDFGCSIGREGNEDRGPKRIEIDFEIAVLADNGSVLVSKTGRYVFKKKPYCTYSYLLNLDDPFCGPNGGSLHQEIFLPFDVEYLYLSEYKNEEEVSINPTLEKHSDSNYAISYSISQCWTPVEEKLFAFTDRRCIDYSMMSYSCSIISKRKLIANKDLYLKNDVLLLRCTFKIGMGVVSESVEYSRSTSTSSVKRKQVQQESERVFYFLWYKENLQRRAQ